MPEVKVSPPYVSEGPPRRYGRDFEAEGVGKGRIEEAPPDYMPADANVVSRAVVVFHDRKDLPPVDTGEVHGAPADLWTFRRQIVHEELMTEAVGLCVDAALERAAEEQ